MGRGGKPGPAAASSGARAKSLGRADPAPAHRPPPWRLPDAASRDRPRAAELRAYRDLWPLPVFFLGLAAFLLAWLFTPAPALSPAQRVELAIEQSLAALEAGRHAEALNHARAAWSLIGQVPGRAAEVRFLMGSAYLLGGAAADAGLDDATAASRARVDLEAADPLRLPEAWRPARALRLARAVARLGAPAEAQLPHWLNVVKANPAARAEGCARLVELYQRLEPPDLEKALEATERWLLVPELKNPNPVRLLRGRLLLELGRPAEARQTLARIPPTASEGAVARDLRARSHFAEGAYAEAAALWQEALQEDHPTWAPAARYFLGCCYLRQGRPEPALACWRPLLEAAAASPEKTAAQFGWLEYQARHDGGGAQLEALQDVLGRLAASQPANPYLPPARLRESLDQLLAHWQQTGRYDAVLAIAPAARPWAPAGEVDRRLGEAGEAAGLRGRAALEAAGGERAPDEVQAVRAAFIQAAEAFTRLSDEQQREGSASSWSWRAAENWLRAGDYAQAAALFEKELRRPLAAGRRAEGLIALGEAYHGLGEYAKAAARLSEALRHAGPHEGRARYLLAMAQVEQQRYAEAEAALAQLAASKNIVPEPREVKQARFALGYVLFRQKRYAEAASALEAAVAQYPDDVQSWTARYWCAVARRELAQLCAQSAAESQTETARAYYVKQRQQELAQALALFEACAAHLRDRQPTPANRRGDLERDARLAVGNCLLDLERPNEALTAFEALSLEWAGRPDELSALMGLARAQVALGRGADARGTLARLRARLQSLTDEAVAATGTTRAQWLHWLGAADRAAHEGTEPHGR
jgi:tetratricopeptide (TPR) repeat protein